MSFQVHTEERHGRQIWIMQGESGAVAEVCPALGFNCYRWYVPDAGELLYCDANFFTDGKPTRSGIPVLFPFPNRIRDGRYSWEGKMYQLPLNDPSGKNAIHGFACRHAWRVVDQGADERSAWVTGEFHAGVDAPAVRALWPADYCLRLTCRLQANRVGWPELRLESLVENPDRVSLPFGLGYHPYFRLARAPATVLAEAKVRATARSYWQLEDSLPTGVSRAVDGARDLRQDRTIAELQLDDLLTDLAPDNRLSDEGLSFRGLVRDEVNVLLGTSADFRELVVFTPPHRQAICLEPYTCITDAINLQQRGIPAGLLVLGSGERWAGVVGVVEMP